jgi:CheY-like chemotaxis protein
MPKSGDTTSSHHRSTSSGPRDSEDAIKQLRAKVIGRKVALHGFDIESPDPVVGEMYAQLKASVTNFLTKWYGFQVVPLGSRTNLIISNEATPSTVSTLARQSASLHRNNPTILVLCLQNDRLDRDISPSDSRSKIGYVAKPVGPLKLAKAIMLCLEGDPPLLTPGPEAPFATPAVSNDLTNIFEELSFASRGELLDNSRMATDSANARKAIESPTPNAQVDKHAEFPFPVAGSPEERPKAHSMPGSKDSLRLLHDTGNTEVASAKLASMELASKSVLTSAKTTDRRNAPSLLLVDDNKINLRLLKAYMLKKRYPVIDEAENGLEAVKKFTERKGGYDIIFMDISMPILDGFGATKQIRAAEKGRRQKKTAEKQSLKNITTEAAGIRNPALAEPEGQDDKDPETKNECLIIALTGLASGRDQQEAADVGVDIFLTKPVSFKEVGRLLDNWEANNERAASSP